MTTGDAVTTKRKKAMAYASTYGLTRDERISLSEMILRRDVDSWKSLTEPELVRVLDSLEGYGLITHLRTGH